MTKIKHRIAEKNLIDAPLQLDEVAKFKTIVSVGLLVETSIPNDEIELFGISE